MEIYCPACQNTSACKGGGNIDCIKRNHNPSIVAGILDTYGGMRVVVTQRKLLKHHVRHDEVSIICPNLTVHEPIAWNDIPIVVRRVEIEIDKWIERHGMPNDPVQQECVVMYRLRCLEHPGSKTSRNINDLAFT